MKEMRRKASAPAAGMFLLMIMIALFSCDSNSKIVLTKSGLLRGLEEDNAWVFRGIPYAAPPVENFRWTPPQDPDPWYGIKNADEFASPCPQAEGAFGGESLNEDCLYLNISIPKSRGPFPVMVWIHGGAFIAGSGSEEGYDPSRLVEEDVIVVTLNYRLGALGFLPHPALTDEAGDSGNYGLMDQQKALKWVKNNIAAFGGNPKNVTIFGESAGGHSVLSHIAAPSSKGLFSKAIVQSGAYSPGQLPLNYGYAAFGLPFATRAGCQATDPAEIRSFLRDMTVEEVLTAQGDDWYLPVTGGSFLPISIQEALATGEFANVPVLSGCNLNEGRLFVALDMAEGLYYNTQEEYFEGVTSLVASDARGLDGTTIGDDYLAMQDSQDANKYRLALSNIWTDYFFNTNNYLQWNQLSAFTNTYAYWFADAKAPNTFSSAYLDMGATHSLEIQYIFGTVAEADGTDEQIALSEEMVGYWTSFAKKGSPHPQWAPFVSGDDSSYVKKLDTPSASVTAQDFATEHNCAYWQEPPFNLED